MTKRRAFTLIELLIVVAIIAILAALALPNFRQARIRAHLARVRSDMRALATALETYHVDNNDYPQAEINGTLKYLFQLTTPAAYIVSKDISDPFTPDYYVSVSQIPTLRYYGFNEWGVLNAESDTGILFSPRSSDQERARVVWYALFCHAPNGVRDNLNLGSVSGTFVKSDIICSAEHLIHFIYDPTNGALSAGEIFRSGGSALGATAGAMRLFGSGV